MSARSVSIVIVTRNRGRRLVELWSRLEASTSDVLEWIFVDDGSVDETRSILEAIAAEDSRVRLVGWPRALGENAALLAGVAAARGRIVVTLADDLRHPPEEISRLVTRVERGTALVYGAPRFEAREPWRGLGRWLASQSFSELCGHPRPTGFRAFLRELAEGAGRAPFLDVTLLKKAESCARLDVEFQRPLEGRADGFSAAALWLRQLYALSGR